MIFYGFKSDLLNFSNNPKFLWETDFLFIKNLIFIVQAIIPVGYSLIYLHWDVARQWLHAVLNHMIWSTHLDFQMKVKVLFRLL